MALAGLLVAAASFGCGRACTSAHPIAGAQARGLPQLVEVAVDGASEPGPRCTVSLAGGGVLSVPADACPLAPGDRLVLPARARGPGLNLPGRGSSEGSKTRIESDDVFPVTRSLDGYWGWVAARRQQAWDVSRGDAALGLVVASSLGMRAALAPEDRDALRAAGLGHLIAVSGLHVGVAALLLQGLALRTAWMMGASPRWAVLPSWLGLVAYVGLTGAAASAVRAGIMLVLVGLGTFTGRPAHGVTVLALAAMLMLAFDPQWLLDPGFCLSVAAMAAIVTAPPETGVLSHSWRVSWAVAPASWWYFGEASAYGLLSNVLAIPMLALWILPSAVLGALASLWLGVAALEPARLGAGLVLDLAHVVASLPRASASAVSIAAALAVLAHVLVRVRARTRAARWLVRTGLVPPLLASLGLLVAVWARSTPTEVDSWYAFGGKRSMSIVAPREDGDGVCIREPRGAPSMWAGLLHGLAIERVAAVSSAEDDPAARDLRAHLDARGMLGGGVDDCVDVDVVHARSALTRCLQRGGSRRAIVRGERRGGRVHCHVAGGWRLLASEAE